MATMVKEKRREKKKKPKEKPPSCVPLEIGEPLPEDTHAPTFSSLRGEHVLPADENASSAPTQTGLSEDIDKIRVPHTVSVNINEKNTDCEDLNLQLDSINISNDTVNLSHMSHLEVSSSVEIASGTHLFNQNETNQKEFSDQLKHQKQSSSDPELKENLPSEPNTIDQSEMSLTEDACPSAPIFDDPTEDEASHPNVVLAAESKPKMQCMPLEEAVRLFGGAEMKEVYAMSEREEALVEAGPVSGPEHPLVDLLSTFRCSLKAVERVRAEIVRGYREEERSRASLWKVEKRRASASQVCACGATVHLQVSYQHAELQTALLPVARMRLEALARDVQESYCHHQHLALLTHCQIEELIADTTESSKGNIREALALVLKELKVADSAPPALATALQRWARTLATALVDARDLRHLLFLLHHLCRQTRSVRWAARLVRLPAGDSIEVARVIALLDLLLCGRLARVDAALECTEEHEETWEEVDARGGSGAVAEGALRERDLVALFRALPLRQAVARLLLFRHQELSQATEAEWGDAARGRGVLKAACGARVLLAVLERAVRAHTQYRRLVSDVVELALLTVHTLADLHLHTRGSYLRELEAQISVELEATFAAAFTLLVSARASLLQLPFRLLPATASMAYCFGFIILLHETETRRIDGAEVEVPASLGCADRVRVIAHACVDRTDDYDLARNALEFLFQIGVKPTSVPCRGGCAMAARECLPAVLRAHPAMYSAALHILADLHQVDNLEPSAVAVVGPQKWRPTPREVHAVLSDWAVRCSALLPTLLLALDYTPHAGVTLESQLTIGAWLCEHERAAAETPEWAWRVLRRLRMHRAWWAWTLDAPPPAAEGGLFLDAFNLLASDWGHSVPVICSAGVAALTRLAKAGRMREATHCLAAALLACAQAPESISMTKQFGVVVCQLLESGPTLMQRALGRGSEPGTALLLKTIAQQLNDTTGYMPGPGRACVWLHALWAHGGACAALLELTSLHSPPRALQHHCTQLQGQLDAAARTERVHELVRHACTCPCACACAVSALAAAQAGDGSWPRLLDALHQQRIANQKIHVDYAMKQTGWSLSSEELAIHQVAAAATAAPHRSPGHLDLWLLFFQLYLQRPPCDMRNTTPPVGPMLFSGITKSRTLAYLKRRLQESTAYHQAEIAKLKAEEKKLLPSVPSRRKESQKRADNPSLALDDDFLKAEVLVAEMNDSDVTSGSGSDAETETENQHPPARVKETQELTQFHCEAEIITKTYLSWLEEGEKVRATPHSLRPLTETARQAACKAELQRMQPPSSPEDEDFAPAPLAPAVTSPPRSPCQRAVRRLLDYARRRRSERRRIRSEQRRVPRETPRSPRALLSAVDAHLRELEVLAEQWRHAVQQVSCADAALWELVTMLRVRSPLPPQRKTCPNKCKPVLIHLQEYEWCVSPGAERSILENRIGARAALRRLAMPRVDAARTAAALQTICRAVRDAETATRVLERAWCSGGDARVALCAPARTALTALVHELAERWISHDASRCLALATAWCGTAQGDLHHTLAASLLEPRRLPPAAFADVYAALLTVNTAPHAAFSYLSKFEISRWASAASREQKRNVLTGLTQAAQAHGPAPDDSYSVLLELIGVHTAAMLDAATLCEVALHCARASAAARLPPAHWTHVLRAADAFAEQVPFDQLGHTLRELGDIWWAARAQDAVAAQCVAYVAHTAKLIRTLLLAFVAAGYAQHYSVERVAYYGWCALQQAWAPWVTPSRHPALLTAEDAALLPAQQLCRCAAALLSAADAEATVLHEVFMWTSGLFPCGQHPSSERQQLAALLAELARLPWRDWLSARAVPALAQICSVRDEESWAWTGGVVSGARAPDWLQGVADQHMAPHLAAVFFVATTLTLDEETIEEVTQLPWWRLPAAALEPALERFFADHHSVSTPYYALPQFRLVLYASELAAHQSLNPHLCRAGAADKRLAAVSLWVRAASSPSLQGHVAHGTRSLLDAITRIAPLLTSAVSEVEALLSRAITILCTEPAGALSLPVWEQWVCTAPAQLTAACISAAAALTVLEYSAAVADCAVRAFLLPPQSPGWTEVAARWRGGHWHEAVAMATRGRLHAAYATLLAHAQSADDVRATLQCLHAGCYNFVESEPILALFACYACRVARAEACGGEAGAAAGRGLLDKWAEPQRRSLLKALTLQPDTDRPTDKLRLLCQYAQYVLTPGDTSLARAFETSCASAGLTGDVSSFAHAPHPRRLLRFAARLFPASELYFRAELEFAPEESDVVVVSEQNI